MAQAVRLLGSGATGKNDPNDARSVAIAALRSPACPPVQPEDHAAVLKIWAKRYRDLSRARNQVVCRMHAVLCQLIPGGVSKRITAGQAARILEQAEPCGAAGMARWVLGRPAAPGVTRRYWPGRPGRSAGWRASIPIRGIAVADKGCQ